LDAVSAVLMHDTIVGDYVLAPSLAAGTDWVVTMPTKREYVNRAEPAQPFLTNWTEKGACEWAAVHYLNRDTLTPSYPLLDWQLGPRIGPLPEVDIADKLLCGAANVISFLGPNVDPEDTDLEGYSSTLYPSERIQKLFPVQFHNGWAMLWLERDEKSINERILTADNGTELYGLPVIGFAVQKYANSTIEGVGNSGAFYSGVSRFKTTRQLWLPSN
jgi:hypothetical protein